MMAKDVMKSTTLRGLGEICRYAQVSEPTLQRLIDEEGFPATKMRGGWISDSIMIDEYYREKIRAQVGGRVARAGACFADHVN
jgi:hypothetical protein